MLAGKSSCILLLCSAAAVGAAQGNSLETHVQAAQEAQARQDCHAAATEYAAAVRLLPTSAALRSNYGVALYCDGQVTAAVPEFRKALGLDPRLVAPHLFLGIAAFRASDLVPAERELRQVTAANASDPTAHLWLGYTLSAQHHYEQAITELEEAARLSPSSVEAEYALAQSWLELGRDRARALERLDPDSPEIAQLAGEQFELRGETDRAQAAFRLAAERKSRAGAKASTSETHSLYEVAHNAEQQARHALETVLATSPESARAHEISAEVLSSRGDASAAIAEYRAALAQDPTLTGVHLQIGRRLLEQGHFAEALSEFKAEQTVQPGSATVLTDVARAQQGLGDDVAALAALKTALTLHAVPPEAYLLLGKAELRQDHAPAAIPLLQRYLQSQPESPAAGFYLLARAYRATGDRAEMAKALVRYQQTSHDAEERRLAEGITRDPGAVRVGMNTQETQDANAWIAAQPHL